MRAAVIKGYGDPGVLDVREVERPEPGPGEVLVRVRSSSVNPVDCNVRRGELRMIMWLRFPAVLGIDLAGEVVAVGEGVDALCVGDEVFGWNHLRRGGAWAQYVVSRAEWLRPRPSPLTMDEAGSLAGTAVTALQGLVHQGELQAGMNVLIVGASGGVGTVAVQIARALGAQVTAICGTSSVEMVRQLGAARVIDYRAENLDAIDERFDLVLDCVGQRSYWAWRRNLTPRGRHVVVPATPRHMLNALLSRLDGRRRSRFFFADPVPADLARIHQLAEDGMLRPVIDRRFGLHEIAEANRYSETGHAHGKIVLQMP